MKHRLTALAGAAALTVFAQAGTAAAQDCALNVGVVYPTSVDWGLPIAETALWVAGMINEAGGVDGCTVNPILRDDQNDARVGVDAARALVDLDRVQLLIGTVSSGVTIPILTSVTAPAGVMQMSCCSSSTRLTAIAASGESRGLWFRTFATSNVQAVVAAMAAREQGITRITILYKNDDWGQDIARLSAAAFEGLGITVAGQIAINDAQPSYRAEVTEALQTQPEAVYLALYPTEGTAVVREWIGLGGTTRMIGTNSLKSEDFRSAVGQQFLTDFTGIDTSAPRSDSATSFVEAFTAHFGRAPSGPGLPNSFDAAAIALLAYHAAGREATGAEIAAQVPRITDPAGEAIPATVEGFARAMEVLSAGGTVSYQGGTGAVSFDANGDVSAPAVTWNFGTDGTVTETRYVTLEEVAALMAEIGE
jgi:branched-chain amino acid transport system substrate-binding protein